MHMHLPVLMAEHCVSSGVVGEVLLLEFLTEPYIIIYVGDKLSSLPDTPLEDATKHVLF